ncbi:TolC family protein [Alteromonas sp. ZYF713]|nr:TolC family protein [Alteromonas sp. ZYF713]
MKLQLCGAALMTALSFPVLAGEQPWASWLMSTVEHHPIMQAYQYENTAAKYQAQALAKPIYNPSLDTSVEREGSETNFQIGMSSDIDWWGVREAQSEAGRLQAEQRALSVQVATNDLLAQILNAQIDVQLGQQGYELARLQVEQDLRLLRLTEQQLAAGEVNRTELAMAKSVVAQGMVAENERLSAWLSAQKTLRILAGEQAADVPVNQAFFQLQLQVPAPQQLLALPVVKQARLEWLAATASAEQQKTANKPVPNVGFGVGRQEGESLFSVSVSVPLQFRNDFSEVVLAARELALASEERLHAQLRDTREAVRNLAEQLQQTRLRFEQWQALHDNEMTEQVEVLQQRYAQGDLSLADYQWQVQQLRDGMQAGLTLQQNYQQTYVAYLHITAGLADVVSSLISPER